MDVRIATSAEEIGWLGAEAVTRLVSRNPDAVLGLATGSSPVGIYDELARRVAAGELSLARCTAYLLDEYVGLPLDHEQCYRRVIERDIVLKVDLPGERVHAPDATAGDLAAACLAYEQAIRDSGGVDLQILGIGSNGHIAFNEPGSSLFSRTRVETLAVQTRLDNARFFGGNLDAVPQHCLTQGLATIMEARHIVLVAQGATKAEAVHHLIEGEVSPLWPASVLQQHSNVTVVVDEAAASRLVAGGARRLPVGALR